MKSSKGVTVISLGCSKNLVDSEQLLHQFRRIGYEIRHDERPRRGDVVVINTCGFIQDAKQESIETILQYCEARRKGQIARLYVMGCLSQRYLEELKLEIPEVDAFYGKFNWQDILRDLGREYLEAEHHCRVLTTPSHYAYIKIAEGCNRHCSFCAIPLITGPYQSRPIEDIKQEIVELVAAGVKEFQILAQDLSYYGKDLYHEFKLAQLIEEISDIKGVEWIRLHYAYPYLFPYDILPVIRERANVCLYLDMALQHCSDHILQLMRRHITGNETVELINRIRREVPGIHLRTTLMVGHPGETDADFEQLKSFVKEMRFERMGAFAYSAEEGTYSGDHYKDDVPQNVKQARLDELMAIQQEISEELSQAKVGQRLRVIIDREEEDYYVGRTEFDSPEVDPEVFVGKERPLGIGAFYDVQIDEASTFDLFGHTV
ncbi:MAG: 30S ribosomal protein S12 methylthiotransferase RimO [Bacteroidales bacterium]|nr:30S ribosomal protein S12 methylthiotransferase RimO [Bacteroidales bacterium]